jgi:lipoprotein-releasing system permease protein
VVVIALTMSFIFSIIPAWRASRVDPVEALRYE